MQQNDKVTWAFHRLGGMDQVTLETTGELSRLRELDPKLWAALSCPASGLEFDARTLELLDSDNDGRIRIPEVLEAMDWVCARLTDPAELAQRPEVEGQFKHYYEMAEKMEGITGQNLLGLLERRLDNVVFRMGMAASRKEARQLVLHAHFTLNGKKVTIPSILVKAGDVIAVKETSKESAKIKALIEGLATVTTPKWIENDAKNAVSKIVALPARDDIDFEFEEQLIVELYSK